ncbi:hypothetical protein C0J52_07152, partial [Blattella germanica]
SNYSFCYADKSGTQHLKYCTFNNLQIYSPVQGTKGPTERLQYVSKANNLIKDVSSCEISDDEEGADSLSTPSSSSKRSSRVGSTRVSSSESESDSDNETCDEATNGGWHNKDFKPKQERYLSHSGLNSFCAIAIADCKKPPTFSSTAEATNMMTMQPSFVVMRHVPKCYIHICDARTELQWRLVEFSDWRVFYYDTKYKNFWEFLNGEALGAFASNLTLGACLKNNRNIVLEKCEKLI